MRFVTVPTRSTATIDGVSVVLPDTTGVRELFAAVARGQFESWFASHPVEELPDPDEVG